MVRPPRLVLQFLEFGPFDIEYKDGRHGTGRHTHLKIRNSFSFGLCLLIVGFGIVRPSENVDAASDKLIPYYIYFKWNV